MHSVFDSVIHLLVNLINQIGYLGIFIGMFLESTLVPLPSEVIMIPAGISASAGTMNIYIAVVVGIIGNVLGAIFSYYLAVSIGRAVLLRIGKYFFVRPETIIRVENFFKNHGPISVFTGRLIPGFRHFISISAGIAKMDIKKFYFYTTAGSMLWTSTLAALGYFIGENQEAIKAYLDKIIISCVVVCVSAVTIYIYAKRRKKLPEVS